MALTNKTPSLGYEFDFNYAKIQGALYLYSECSVWRRPKKDDNTVVFNFISIIPI